MENFTRNTFIVRLKIIFMSHTIQTKKKQINRVHSKCIEFNTIITTHMKKIGLSVRMRFANEYKNVINFLQYSCANIRINYVLFFLYII